ncbi:hypothetical protein RclHR1_00490013 [Rhizophagus clarus]|uniref:Uncharacterized protein n=1 Tax=Rhizophagus clarus TaxID=94130 RepID=A0A2Z6SCY7_9GLOM|nr:hypothetical protein RclHR1_00490013 [Rhizophagus clarus]
MQMSLCTPNIVNYFVFTSNYYIVILLTVESYDGFKAFKADILRENLDGHYVLKNIADYEVTYSGASI